MATWLIRCTDAGTRRHWFWDSHGWVIDVSRAVEFKDEDAAVAAGVQITLLVDNAAGRWISNVIVVPFSGPC